MEVQIPHGKRQLRGGHIIKYRDTLQLSVQKRLNRTNVMPFRLWARTGLRNHKLDRGPDPHGKGQFWRKGVPIVKYRYFLPWAVQKRPNRLICHLGCGFGWAEGSTSSVIFASWEGTLAPPGEYDWTIRLLWRLLSLLVKYCNRYCRL